MKLSDHFDLEELTRSSKATELHIDNRATPAILAELKTTAERLLEPVRLLLGVPIFISSGYRCPALNSAVGGVWNSSHLFGMAADFTAPSVGTPLEICRELERHAAALNFDQLIYEHPGGAEWVHIGRRAGTQRRELWTVSRTGTVAGIVG